MEVRRLWATDALNEYMDWPGVRQVCKVERQVEHNRTGRLETWGGFKNLGTITMMTTERPWPEPAEV